MKKTNKDPSFLHDRNYHDLISYYIDHPIALYTGAGVSKSDNPKFGVGLWDDFVRNILIFGNGVNSKSIDDFEKNKLQWKGKPWEMAEWVAYKIGYDTFKQRVTEIIQKKENFRDKYKLLSSGFLGNAITLNATVAFCAGFAGGKKVTDKKGYDWAVYQRAINPRVRAVVTSNYDPFLEAASSTMFRKPILKPVAARGSSVGNLMEIPTFHIHGYVPVSYEFRKKERVNLVPFVDPVITTTDYKSAWKANNVYNFTMGPQIHILRHYAVLFIGFSFRDKWVNRLLIKLNEERKQRSDRLYHYTLMSKNEINMKGSDYFIDQLGVKPIPLDDFHQTKDLLGHLYQQGLVHDCSGDTMIALPLYAGKNSEEAGQPILLALAEYYDELFSCRLSMVRKKKIVN